MVALLVGVLMWFVSPLLAEMLYRAALADYQARLRRSVAITPANAWLGLFVEAWDGQPPRRMTYMVAGRVARWLWLIVGICLWIGG